jgi:hypothetical protein
MKTTTVTRQARIESPFYALTWERALEDFHDGLLTPRGLIYCHFAINLRPGAETTVNVEELCEQLGIHEATYYRAIGALKARGRLNVKRGQMVVGVPQIRPLRAFSQMCDSNSQNCDSGSHICELNSQMCDQHSQMCENGNPLNASADEPSRNRANVPNRSRNIDQNKQTQKVPTTHPVDPASPAINKKELVQDSDPLEGEVNALLEAISEAGVIPNKTIAETIAQLHLEQGSAAAAEATRNALSSLAEQQERGMVRNPGGFLIAALKEGFTANQAKVEAREKRSRSEPLEKPRRAPAMNQVSAQIDSYLMNDHQDWAIGKLQSLWDEGWHDQVEELLQLRRQDWKLSIVAGRVSYG